MRLRGRQIDLSRPWLVGILNVTPDSFSDGGRFSSLDALLRQAEAMQAAGADLLDVGGESTRPGAQAVSIEEESARVLPAVAALTARLDIAVAIDTRRAAVAAEALLLGAAMINDVSAFGDPDMAAAIVRHDAAWVLMHMPHPVGAMPASQLAGAMPADLAAGLAHITLGLADAVDRAVAAGVARSQLAVDPGIGFGKTIAQNLALLRGYGPLASLGLPVYLGPSRKSFIAVVSQGCGREVPVDARLPGTAAAVTAAVLAGAAFVRVHDVAAMRQVMDVATALRDVPQD